VIRKGQQPRTVATQAGAFLDDQDNVIAWRGWYGKSECDNKVTLQSGKVIFAPSFDVDSASRLFCYGGDYYDYKAGTKRTDPIRIASIDDPENTRATSELQGLLAGVFTAGNNIYVVARDSNRLVCEEYERDGSAVARKRRFDISPPAKLAVAWLVPADFDPVFGSFLVEVGRDLPLLGGPLWYVYDIKTGQFRKVGVFEGYAGFLDPHLFDRTLEGLSSQPSQRK
jgi:hypothetical protein